MAEVENVYIAREIYGPITALKELLSQALMPGGTE